MNQLTVWTFSLAALVAFSACSQPSASEAPSADPAPEPQQTANTAGPPVSQPPPNKADAKPAFPQQTRAPEQKSNVKLASTVIADNLEEAWAMGLLPNGEVLITEKTGKLWRVTREGKRNEVTGVPKVDARGQGGLLDISPAPGFTQSRLVYFSFSEPRGGGKNGTSLARARLSDDGTKLENVQVIFRQDPPWNSEIHYGSNIAWDSAGNLFLTLGERYEREARDQAQTLDNLLGKVVHLTPDGKPAPGNPFLNTSNARAEIWSYGHRNVQGAAIHPDTGKLWTIEHGPRGGDEINIPQPGKNYGWPIICYCIDYPGGPIGEGITAKEGMEQPVYYWDPVIAPGDMIFYRGDMFPWRGDILAAGMSGAMVRLHLDGERVVGEERLLTDLGRIRDIEEDFDGSLYVLTNDSPGALIRVTAAKAG